VGCKGEKNLIDAIELEERVSELAAPFAEEGFCIRLLGEPLEPLGE